VGAVATAAGSTGVAGGATGGGAGAGGETGGTAGASGTASGGAAGTNAGNGGTSGGGAGASGAGGASAGNGNGGDGGAAGAPAEVWACDDCPEPMPTLTDWINGHGDTMTLLDHDGHVAIYVSDNVNTEDAAWVLEFASNAMQYMKLHYDMECHYGDDRLYVFLHQGTHGGGTISSYFDQFSTFRNAVDMGAASWERDIANINIDLVSHEMAHIVEGSSNCIHESPGFGVWGDSKWAEIFQYDLYLGLGMMEDADKMYDRFMNGNDPWFPEFYYPMYDMYGGVEVLNNFFKLLAEHFPTRLENDDMNPIYTRRLNLGELIHFYSGASNADVSDLALNAFGDTFAEELAQAKLDFPAVTY
jgi:hypothetical protein